VTDDDIWSDLPGGLTVDLTPPGQDPEYRDAAFARGAENASRYDPAMGVFHGDELPVELIATLDLVALAATKAKPKEFVIERLAPAGEVTLFTGPGSAGKSLLAQQLATAAAAGVSTLGFAIQPTPSIYLTCEDDAEQLHWRQAHLCDALRVPLASLDGKLHLASVRGQLGSELATFAQDGTLKLTESYKRLAATMKSTGARVAFLDNVAHLFTGNENDRGEVTRFVNLLNRLAGETGSAIVLLGHPNKHGDSYSGSTAWLNVVRSHFTIEHDTQTDMRTLTIGKANYARKGDETRFFWQDWAFVSEEELAPDRAQEFKQCERDGNDNGYFLAALRELSRQLQPVSEKPNAANYAPKRFARMPETKGVGKDRLERAMDRLFRLNSIERGELWKGPDRKPVIGLREVRDGPEHE
jgi:RecA-family ATPase